MTEARKIHFDMIGNEIRQGDFVVGSYGDGVGIAIYVVTKVCAKTLVLRKFDVKNPRSKPRRYSNELVKLNDEQTKDLLFAVIKNTGA